MPPNCELKFWLISELPRNTLSVSTAAMGVIRLGAQPASSLAVEGAVHRGLLHDARGNFISHQVSRAKKVVASENEVHVAQTAMNKFKSKSSSMQDPVAAP